jgi:hypothetical protein
MQRPILSKAHGDLLLDLYTRTSKTLDDLPYTEEFEDLFTAFVARTGRTITRHDIWRALSNLRKAKRLVRKAR